MRLLAISAVAALLFGAAAHGQTCFPGTPNCPGSDNTYRSQQNANGSVTTYGSNTRNNTNWQSTAEPNANQSGVNAQGEHWSYDSQTRTYSNPQANRHCFVNAYGQSVCSGS
jgi:hypothetical protein